MGATDPSLAMEKPQCSSVKGLYMWGGVGVGKTMLMDLFVEAAPKHFQVKRAHFLDFMPEVHALLQQHSGEQVRVGAMAPFTLRTTQCHAQSSSCRGTPDADCLCMPLPCVLVLVQ